MSQSRKLRGAVFAVAAASLLCSGVTIAQEVRAPASFGLMLGRLGPDQTGATIAAVLPGGVFEQIGIKEGDTIVAVDDERIADGIAFSTVMRRYREGDVVTFTVVRNGKELKFTGKAKAGKNAVRLKEDADKIVEEMAAALEKRYVLPEVGARYAATLRANLAKGAYYNMPDELAFAEKVSADLKQVYEDRHLYVAVTNGVNQPAATRYGRPIPPVDKLERLNSDIAYMRFGRIPEDEQVENQVIDWMKANADAKTLIIDLRMASIGGTPNLPYRMLTYFFPTLTPIGWVEFRKTMYDEFVAAGFPPTLPEDREVKTAPGFIRFLRSMKPSEEATGLRKIKVYVLTSEVTGSAWEVLADGFQASNRATLVGEATAGRGNPSRWVSIGSAFRILIPSGRFVSFKSGKSFELTGVQPDVEVPAERALTDTLIRIGLAPSKAAALSESVGAKTAAMYFAKPYRKRPTTDPK